MYLFIIFKISYSYYISFSYIWQSSSDPQNNTCIMCHDLYVDLNDIYNRFVNRISTYEAVGVCMDIVDQVNV